MDQSDRFRAAMTDEVLREALRLRAALEVLAHHGDFGDPGGAAAKLGVVAAELRELLGTFGDLPPAPPRP